MKENPSIIPHKKSAFSRLELLIFLLFIYIIVFFEFTPTSERLTCHTKIVTVLFVYSRASSVTKLDFVNSRHSRKSRMRPTPVSRIIIDRYDYTRTKYDFMIVIFLQYHLLIGQKFGFFPANCCRSSTDEPCQQMFSHRQIPRTYYV